MDPVTSVGVGMVANLAHDVAQGTVSLATDESLDTRIERAAETVADDYGEFDPDHLLNALDSEEMGERVERFERGDPLRIAEITRAFREQTAAAKFVDADPEADVETVVEQFVTELQTELAAEPVAWRRMVLREIKRGSRGVERIEAAQETLAETVRAELDDTRLVSATALKEAIEQSDGQGFEWVTETEFERGRVEDHYCWRRSFTLAEAYCGYPLRRQRPSTGGDSERQDLTTELLDTLAEHGGAALLGAPGSGKTTATRLALAAWYDQIPGGTVLYRKQDAQTPLDPAELNEAIETAREGGPVLVVVEDAARRGTYPVYETVDEFAGDPAVRFLVNSRTEEWRDSESGLRAAAGGFSQAGDDIVRVQSEAFKQVDMPGIDAREVERFVTNYEEVTGRIVSLADPNKLLSQVRSHAGISPMLLLAYHVPVWEGEIDARADGDVPALVANVREVYTLVHGGSKRKSIKIDETDRERFRQLALAVNVLNAAEAGVWREHLLGVAEDTKAMLEIDKLLAKLQGPLLFGQEGQQYRTHHPLWSRLYLSEHLEQASSPAAARLRFGECVTTVFELFDSDERRDAVEEFLGETERLGSVDRSPTVIIDRLVEKVFNAGVRRPELAPLFGTSGNSHVELPKMCSPEMTIQVAFWRASMYGQRGESDKERAEIETAKSRYDGRGLDSEGVLAEYHRMLGHHAQRRDAFQEARKHYQQAREDAPNVGGGNEAKLLTNLGVVAHSLGKFEQARDYHYQSLKIHQEINNPVGKANNLGNLGVVMEANGKFRQAYHYHRQSLEIHRDIGNRVGEAKSLGNLGLVARNLGKYEQAYDYHHQSLKIHRDIGSRADVAIILTNLGNLEHKQENYQVAIENYREAADIFSGVGAVKRALTVLSNLSEVAVTIRDEQMASNTCEEALELIAVSDLNGLDEFSREFRDRVADLNN